MLQHSRHLCNSTGTCQLQFVCLSYQKQNTLFYLGDFLSIQKAIQIEEIKDEELMRNVYLPFAEYRSFFCFSFSETLTIATCAL